MYLEDSNRSFVVAMLLNLFLEWASNEISDKVYLTNTETSYFNLFLIAAIQCYVALIHPQLTVSALFNHLLFVNVIKHLIWPWYDSSPLPIISRWLIRFDDIVQEKELFRYSYK